MSGPGFSQEATRKVSWQVTWGRTLRAQGHQRGSREACSHISRESHEEWGCIFIRASMGKSLASRCYFQNAALRPFLAAQPRTCVVGAWPNLLRWSFRDRSPTGKARGHVRRGERGGQQAGTIHTQNTKKAFVDNLGSCHER